MTTPITKGVHHIGLTVSKLEESAAFFTTLLGWREVRRNEDYPAIFVSDGHVMVTLWALKGGVGLTLTYISWKDGFHIHALV